MDLGDFLGLWSISIVALVAFVIFIFVKSSKTMGSTKMKKPSKIKFFKTPQDIKRAIKIIIEFAPTNGYQVDDYDDANNIIVLSETTTAKNFGNIFPVYFSTVENQTLIEIGIKNKGTQRFFLDEYHNKCFNGIRSAFYFDSNNQNNDTAKSFCSNCGKSYAPIESIKFCAECGNKL